MVDPTTNPMKNEPADMHWVRLISIIYLSILSVATTFLNGFTLFVIYKDPLKCFRTPLTIFITGLIASDFIVGLLGEPLLAVSRAQENTMDVRIVISTSVDASFLIMLALAIAQLQAVRKPEVYQRWFTNCRARVIIVCIWIYAMFFSFIPELTDAEVNLSLFRMNIFLNVLVVAIILIVITVVTYKIFKRNLALNEEQAVNPGRQQIQTIEKEFFKGTLILTVVLIFAVLPLLIDIFLEALIDVHHSPSLRIVGIMFRDILFLKFLLDPLVFIFRVPKYRRAVRMVCAGKCGCVQDGYGDNAAQTVRYNRDDDITLFTELTQIDKMVNQA